MCNLAIGPAAATTTHAQEPFYRGTGLLFYGRHRMPVAPRAGTAIRIYPSPPQPPQMTHSGPEKRILKPYAHAGEEGKSYPSHRQTVAQ